MSRVWVLIGFLIMSPFSYSASFQTGKVAQLLVHDNGAGVMKFDVQLIGGEESNMDWCSTSKKWTVAIGTEASKMQFSMLLSAKMAGDEIILHADNTKNCPDGSRNRIRNVELL